VLQVRDRISNIFVDSFETDFFPMAYAEVAEPIMAILGYGNFRIRPSPQCAMLAVLVNHDKSELKFESLNRLLDVEQFFKKMQVLAHKLRPKNVESSTNSDLAAPLENPEISFWTARKVQKILEKCMLRKNLTPTLASVFSSKESELEVWARELQFVIVHNNMDLASMDVMKRVKCFNMKNSILHENEVTCNCMGCI
jgi:hypothetical protein